MSQLWDNIRFNLSRDRSLPQLEKRGADGIVPLTFGQQRIWFVESLMSHRPQHQLSQNLEIVGPLDVDRFRSALQLVVNQHEALRTCIRTKSGIPHQSIEPRLNAGLELVDLSAPREPGKDLNIDSIIQAHMPSRLGLGIAPLWRFCLFKLADRHYLLIGRIHHIIFDKWSGGIFQQELFNYYYSSRNIPPHPKPESRPGYGDFALWQRSQYSERWLNEKLMEWRQYFGKHPQSTRISGNRKTSAKNEAAAGRVTRAIPDSIIHQAMEFCTQRGISSFTLFIAAFFIQLRKITGQNDLMICSPVSGRNLRQTRTIIGFFSNIVIYRVLLDPESSIEFAINSVAERAQRFQAFSELPFDMISTSPELRSVPVDSIMFAFHNTPDRVIESGELRIKPYRITRQLADQEFSFSVFRRNRQYVAHVLYRKKTYTKKFVNGVIGQYFELLDSLLNVPLNTNLKELTRLVSDID